MVLQLGNTAPDFVADSTEGTINFHDWIGDSWCILFSHPKDHTPVCTTELGQVAHMNSEFEKRNVKTIGLSVDTPDNHQSWCKDIEKTQNCSVNFPIIADVDKNVSHKYGMIHPNEDSTHTVRSVFIIDQNKKIRLMITYPMATGRNFDEILRTVDSLQRTDEYKVATPANWSPGDDVIIVPTVSDEEAMKLFPEGFRAETSYLRYVSDPQGKKKSAA